MDTRNASIPSLPSPIEFREVHDQVLKFWSGLHENRDNSQATPLIVTYQCNAVDILAWLRNAPQLPRMYWCSRDGNIEMGGYGSLITISERNPDNFQKSIDTMSRIVRSHPPNPAVAFLGGLCFNSNSTPDDLWAAFPDLMFTLPQVSVMRIGDRFHLSAGEMIAHNVEAAQVTENVIHNLQASSQEIHSLTFTNQPEIVSRQDFPDYETWLSNVQEILSAINHKEVSKVVLARRTDLELSRSLDSFEFLFLVKKANPHNFFFLYEPQSGKTFLSSTPELLVNIEQQKLTSDAVAGTIVRGQTPVEDFRQSQALSDNSKEILEHRYVADDILAKFQTLCSHVQPPARPTLMKLASIHHLVSKITGTLRDDKTLGEILSVIHPTPAVSGTPLQLALELIHSLERFNRGWYAGPVGLIAQQCVEFAVGIRSALVFGNRVSLFAGSGIVAGSNPHAEWQEVDAKLTTAIRILSGRMD